MTTNIGLPTDGVENKGWKLYITSTVMVIVAGLFTITRFLARYKYQTFGWDDYTVLMSLVASIALSVLIQLAVVNGYGKHKSDLSKSELSDALMFFFAAQTPYKVVVCLNKTSVTLLYMRIFVTKGFKRICYVVLSVILGYSVGSIFATIFQCWPIAGSWDKTVKAQCIDSDVFWVAYAVLNILTDVMVLSLPIPQIMKLQLKTQEKIAVTLVFLMGGFVTITSILRATAVSNSVPNKADITYNFITRGIWTLVEANTGIICACLPILKLPVSRMFPQLLGATKIGGTWHYTGTTLHRKRSFASNEPGRSNDDTQTEVYHSARSSATRSLGRDHSDQREVVHWSPTSADHDIEKEVMTVHGAMACNYPERMSFAKDEWHQFYHAR